MGARYQQNFGAFGRLVLRSEGMRADMASRADRIKAQFVATAPVGDPVESDDHAGRYRDSAESSSGTDGGPNRDRAFGRVDVTDPAAMSIEFGHVPERGPDGKFAERGTGKAYPPIEGHHTLTRALDAAGDA